MTTVSYAENAEDIVLSRALRPEGRTGFWIDVRAGHPSSGSVTALFSERMAGVNVESRAELYRSLCAGRPGDINVRAALDDVDSPNVQDEPAGDSGIAAEESAVLTSARVPVLTLKDICARYVDEPVDFLKIHAQGNLCEVLKAADWSDLRPKIVVIGTTARGSAATTDDSWERVLLDADYAFALFDGLNRFYVSKALPDFETVFAALAAPANATDDYVPHRHVLDVEEARRELSAQLRSARDLLELEREARLRVRDDLVAAECRAANALQQLHTLKNHRVIRRLTPFWREYQRIRRHFAKK